MSKSSTVVRVHVALTSALHSFVLNGKRVPASGAHTMSCQRVLTKLQSSLLLLCCLCKCCLCLRSFSTYEAPINTNAKLRKRSHRQLPHVAASLHDAALYCIDIVKMLALAAMLLSYLLEIKRATKQSGGAHAASVNVRRYSCCCCCCLSFTNTSAATAPAVQSSPTRCFCY